MNKLTAGSRHSVTKRLITWDVIENRAFFRLKASTASRCWGLGADVFFFEQTNQSHQKRSDGGEELRRILESPICFISLSVRQTTAGFGPVSLSQAARYFSL